MLPDRKRIRKRASAWLVRVWFGAVGLTAIVLVGLLAHDVLRGEGISHLGLPFFLEIAAVAVISVALALLPLLIIAVVIDRNVKA